MLEGTQFSLLDESAEYREFVKKFKPKKTTDECYTPPEVYEVVLDYCVEQYGIHRDDVVRPFYPGGDYERQHYPRGAVVIDNPPFSKITRIVRHYQDVSMPFFIFAPHLTNFSSNTNGITHIIASVKIIYSNGAIVNTDFLTNLSCDILIQTAPELNKRIKEAQRDDSKRMTKISFPDQLITAAKAGVFADNGADFRVMANEATFVRSVGGREIFGGGYLLNEAATERKKAAEKQVVEKKSGAQQATEKIELTAAAAAIVRALSR